MALKKIYNYTVLISREENKYIAHCPAFPGCVCQADTYERVLEEIAEGVKTFIEIHRKKKWPLPNETVPSMTIVKVAVNE